MTYELAKQLKDAGFLQNEEHASPDRFYCPHKDESVDSLAVIHIAGCQERVYIPALSELIEACGDRFEKLSRRENKKELIWRAWGYGTFKMENMEGLTPEEAVAKLWLELNKHGDNSQD